MRKLLLICLVAGLLTACGMAGDGKKAADAKILSLDDFAKEYRADKAAAKAKYDGKEFLMVAKVGSPLSEYSLKSDDGKYYHYGLMASEPIGFMCMVPVEEKAKFDNLPQGSVVTVKGTIVINDKGAEMRPCSRDFRDAK